MFKLSENRLSASNSAVMASEGFLIPVTVHSEAKTSAAALDALQQAFVEVSRYLTQLSKTAPGIALVPFHESIAPRLSRVQVARSKDHRFDLTFVLKSPIPSGLDFWGRIRLISTVYEQLSGLAADFHQRPGVTLLLEEARLDQQKDAGAKSQDE
jgi:hypothetical protein